MRKISRQYKWQLKQLAKGKCIICGKPVITKSHCRKHALAQNKHVRKYKERREKCMTTTTTTE